MTWHSRSARFARWSLALLLLSAAAGCPSRRQSPGWAAAMQRDTFGITPAAPGSVQPDGYDEASDVRAVADDHPPVSETVAFAAPTASGPNLRTITLDNDFIAECASRVTFTSRFDPVGINVHSVSSDGDAHISGVFEAVQLPMVAELMNAAEERDLAVAFIEQRIEEDQPFDMTGVWRLWCEHPGREPHVQGAEIPDYEGSTNPDHVFEIHPVTVVGIRDVTHTIKTIPPGYTTKDAERAFGRYESLWCEIEPGDTTTTIRTQMVAYNYPEFVMQMVDVPAQGPDGCVVMAWVYDATGETLLVDSPRRMVFIEGTAAEETLRNTAPLETLHVLGMPRIDLGVIAARAATGTKLAANLPYEIVVVGVYED